MKAIDIASEENITKEINKGDLILKKVCIIYSNDMPELFILY